jgi:fumarate hydratase subunit alpha
VIHTRVVPGDRLDITFDAKGGGCENMSVAKVLKPADGIGGVAGFVVDRIVNSGGNPCPPLVVGVGVGGSFERSAELAKRSLMRPLGQPNPEAHLADLEGLLMARINATGIGPMGLGGRVTALAVHVEAGACHIASLPVAVNLDCHSHRHRRTVL